MKNATTKWGKPGTIVTFRRDGVLYEAVVGPSGKLICKRPATA